MMVDWGIRISDIMVAGGMLGSVIFYSFKAGALTKSIELMETQIKALEEVSRTIAGTLTTLAVQKSQIERIERDIDGLRRGEGFVIQRRVTIEGEYDG